jgi:hypothetical protein
MEWVSRWKVLILLSGLQTLVDAMLYSMRRDSFKDCIEHKKWLQNNAEEVGHRLETMWVPLGYGKIETFFFFFFIFLLLFICAIETFCRKKEIGEWLPQKLSVFLLTHTIKYSCKNMVHVTWYDFQNSISFWNEMRHIGGGFFCCFVLFWDKVLLCCPSWPQTCYPPASASWVLRSQWFRWCFL